MKTYLIISSKERDKELQNKNNARITTSYTEVKQNSRRRSLTKHYDAI